MSIVESAVNGTAPCSPPQGSASDAVPSLAESVAAAEVTAENRAAARIMADVAAQPAPITDEQEAASMAAEWKRREDEQAAQVRRTEGATAARVPQEWKPSLRLNRGRSWHPEDATRENRMREAEWWRERLLEVLSRPDRPACATDAWTRTIMMQQTLRDIEHVLWQFGWRDGAAAARVRPSVPPLKFRVEDGFLASGTEDDPAYIDPQDAGDMLRMAYKVCVGLDRHVAEGRLTDGLILGWLYELQTELSDHGDALGERGLKRPEWSPL